MFFKKKIKRVLDVEEIEKKHKNRPDLELEKGDKLAIGLAAIVVFVPVLFIVLGVFMLAYFLFAAIGNL